MMPVFSQNIPQELIQFLIVTVFSLIIGLSQRHLHVVKDDSHLFGTDRTFTFIGIWGYILYIIDHENVYLFIGGGLILAVFLAIFYYSKIRDQQDFGLTTVIIALITYSLTPLLLTQPIWLFLLIVVTVLIFTELKRSLTTLTTRFDKEEFITLGKFLIIAGVILPIIPDVPILPGISLTPTKIWLAVVVVSSVSYISYLLQKFIFRESGIIISGILGGLYSSTATTVILSRKSAENHEMPGTYAVGILYAVSMMYFRIAILVFIFNASLFRMLIMPLALLFLVSIATGLVIHHFFKPDKESGRQTKIKSKLNPLEFRVALLFALLYIIFFLITHYTIKYSGNQGLNFLAFISGLSDIDPFLLSLFQGKFELVTESLARATLIAMASNNVAKMAYAYFLGNSKMTRILVIGLSIITLANTLFILLF